MSTTNTVSQTVDILMSDGTELTATREDGYLEIIIGDPDDRFRRVDITKNDGASFWRAWYPDFDADKNVTWETENYIARINARAALIVLDLNGAYRTQPQVDDLPQLPFPLPSWASEATRSNVADAWEAVSITSERGVFISQIFVNNSGIYEPEGEPEVEVDKPVSLEAVHAHALAEDIEAAADAIFNEKQPIFPGTSAPRGGE